MSVESDFFEWVDRLLAEELPEGIVAYNFNLYECEEPEFHVQLIGASEFSREDSDWACAEVFSSGEDVFCVPRATDETWEGEQQRAVELVRKYLESGARRATLTSARAVGAGFVDGDLELVFESSESR